MHVLEQVIGWLAPPVCVGCGLEGAALCSACRQSEVLPYGEHCAFCATLSPDCQTCSRCRRNGLPRHVFISTDYLGLGAELLKNYKFGHQRAASLSIADIMSHTFKYFGFEDEDYVIVPVPSATSRTRQRGFDHTFYLARLIADQFSMPFMPVLGRLGQSRQVGSHRSERLKQLAGAYFVRQPKKIYGRNVLIVDDVITTGATLRETYKVLRKAGAKKVDALAFAKRI